MAAETRDWKEYIEEVAEEALRRARRIDDVLIAEAKDTVSDVRTDPTPFIVGGILGAAITYVLCKVFDC